MADNEKLDNQRLKNFKNKGRDLEVNSRALEGWGAVNLGRISAGTWSVGSRGGSRRRAAGEWRWGPARP